MTISEMQNRLIRLIINTSDKDLLAKLHEVFQASKITKQQSEVFLSEQEEAWIHESISTERIDKDAIMRDLESLSIFYKK